MEGGEGDEVSFVERCDFEKRMANLFDLDCAGEGGFLCVVTLQLEGLSTVLIRLQDQPTLTPCFSFLMQYAVTGG